MARNLSILFALVAIVGLPFLLRPKQSLLMKADETLVIISPHHEGIRYEFARGFRDWYKARTGKLVRIDWRIPGGTTEIARILASEYQAPFENLWRYKMKMHWDDEAQRSFDDPKVKIGPDAAKDTLPQMARRAFLDSQGGIGIDLFFGGGSFDFAQQSAAGRLCGQWLYSESSRHVRRRTDADPADARRRTILGQGRYVVRMRPVVIRDLLQR